jgi:hypothetical protein
VNSGIARGGPFHGYPLHNPELEQRIAVDQHSRRPIVGMVSSTDPFIKFGTYRFADGVWAWQE